MSAEYRIEYSIQRADEEGGEFTEIGFGSSASWSDLDSAVHALGSDIANGQWETQQGMPDPDVVVEAIRAAAAGADL